MLQQPPRQPSVEDATPRSRSDETTAIRRSVMHATLQYALGSQAVIRRFDHHSLEPEGTQDWIRNATR